MEFIKGIWTFIILFGSLAPAGIILWKYSSEQNNDTLMVLVIVWGISVISAAVMAYDKTK